MSGNRTLVVAVVFCAILSIQATAQETATVLLTFDDAHDITDAVVEKLLSRRAVVQSANPPTVATRPAPASSTQR